MNSILIFAAAGNPVAEVAEKFGLEPRLLVSQMVLFVIVALLMKKFAYGPVLKMLDERKHRISEALSNAEKIKEELARTEKSRQEILDNSNAEANKLIGEARIAAAKVLEVETQKAIATAAEIIAKARQASDAELARMKAELRREVGRLVVDTTAKVTGKVLTMDDQQRLAAETNKQLAA